MYFGGDRSSKDIVHVVLGDQNYVHLFLYYFTYWQAGMSPPPMPSENITVA